MILPQLTSKCIWFPIIKKWLKINQSRKKVCYLAIDRTRWQERNLFVASLVKDKRAIPLNWILLDKKGNSNIGEQKRLLKSTLRLLKGYQVVVIGDRKFGNINLAIAYGNPTLLWQRRIAPAIGYQEQGVITF